MDATTSMNALSEAALALPQKDRAALAAILIDSLDEDDDPVEAKKEWDAEIKRRIESTDRGDVALLSHEEVWQRLEAKNGKLEN
jgi:putative addiction module component (TIGR02574 family)